ncbi:MAG: rod shape-determining protein RodA [Candidatus Desulfofervidaceae bacterium]|nr:rod shape-determining protein RodA [Candidatus Desulfofervidaceae bacterium]
MGRNSSFLKSLSGQILLILTILVSLGLLNLYSATHQLGVKAILFKKQLLWAGMGFIFLFIINFIDYRKFYFYAYHIYIATILLLVIALFFAPRLMGARRWLPLGPVTIQPSELAKLVIVVILARYFSDSETPSQDLNSFLKALSLTIGPVFLIALEPDLGTALIITILFGSLCVISRVNNKVIIGTVLISCFLSPLMWQFVLKDYQKARILGFLFPQKDPFGIGYHILQSKITVGSGQLFGKGFLKGTQTQLRFLPEHYTDFIFSVFAEEWGFIGCITLLTCYFLLFLTGLRVCKKTTDTFGFLLASGITAMLFWQTVINIAMALGLLPVVGVPLPFMSYGGSAILTNFIAVGILMKIGRRKLIGG